MPSEFQIGQYGLVLAESWETMLAIAQWAPAFFVFAIGACVGSLTNVIVYRVPLGLDIVTPPSRCPSCETRLTWRENIPILGWVIWMGRCRYCKSKISPEYPLVELAIAVLFGGLYVLFYIVPNPAAFDPGRGVWLGVNWSAIKPEWAWNGPAQTWPAFVVVVFLMGSLAAMLLVDSKTYMIPLFLPIAATVVGLFAHPLHALWVQKTQGSLHSVAPGWLWTIPTPSPSAPSGAWWWFGGCVGAVVGLVISWAMMKAGLIRRSFADYPAWEAAQIEKQKAQAATDGSPPPGSVSDDPAELWIAYPHARREMVKELAYLGPAAGLACLGAWLAPRLAGVREPVFDPVSGSISLEMGAMLPLWAHVLGGVMLGYLVGGGIVWGIRILGSLLFGKEAMGLGDVHIMAAVGACLGWIDATLGFFVAAFVGLGFEVLRRLLGGAGARAMPFGPSLAVGTLLVVLFKPLIEAGLTRLMHAEVPINIP